MFAVPNTYKFLVRVVFLCTASSVLANNTSYQIPEFNCSVKTLNVFGDTGGDSFSYFNNISIFHSQMPNTVKNVSPAKLSSRENTPYIATNVPTSFSACHNTASAIVQGENNHLTINYEFKSTFSKEDMYQILTEILNEFTEKGCITIHSKTL